MKEGVLIYDVEIAKAIPDQNSKNILEGIKYCQGWSDFAGMGISVICAWDGLEKIYHVYLEDNLSRFQELVNQRKIIIGFNSLSFDDVLCAAHGLQVQTTFDILRAIRKASGQPEEYIKGITRTGYNLGNLCSLTFGLTKTESGDQAPILWQRGEKGRVIDYCLRDVALTRKLLQHQHFVDPSSGQEIKFLEDEEVLSWASVGTATGVGPNP